MVSFIFASLSRLGRRALFGLAILGALGAALVIARREGKAAGQAALAIRQADARLRAMKISKETRHEIRTSSDADLDRRLDRWMRDGPQPPSR
jgi:hypothetical protein